MAQFGGCIGYALGFLTGAPPTIDEIDRVVESLTKIADVAKQRGIALEVCPSSGTEQESTV